MCLLSITNPKSLQPEEGSEDKALFSLAFHCFQCMLYSESALLNRTNLQVLHVSGALLHLFSLERRKLRGDLFSLQLPERRL